MYAVVKRALSAAMARSESATRLRPTPAATPLTAAITGASSRIRRATAIFSGSVISCSKVPTRSDSRTKVDTSPPAQNALLPLPVISTARTSRRWASSAAIAESSRMPLVSSALKAAGLSSVSDATPADTSNRIMLMDFPFMVCPAASISERRPQCMPLSRQGVPARRRQRQTRHARSKAASKANSAGSR